MIGVIIGAGDIGYKFKSKNNIYNYYDALKKIKKIKKTILIDKIANNKKIKNFTYLNNLKFEKDKILLIIATPDKEHLKNIKYCLKFFKPSHIILEKLPTKNIKEFDELIKLQKKNKFKIYVNFFRRNLKSFNRLKSIIKKNEPKNILVYFTHNMVRNGCHFIDLLFFLLGKKFQNYKLKIRNKENFFQFSNHLKNKKISLINLSNQFHADDIRVYFKNFCVNIKNHGTIFEIEKPKKWYLNNNNYFFESSSVTRYSNKNFLVNIINNFVNDLENNSDLKSSKLTMKLLKKLDIIS